VTKPDLGGVIPTTHQVPCEYDEKCSENSLQVSQSQQPFADAAEQLWGHRIFPLLKFVLIVIVLVVGEPG
jgi:hypothetical protein